MNARFFCFALLLIGALLAGCASQARVGALRTESQSVELGDASSVRVEVELGAGDLDLTSGAEKLLEADFTYNVAELKPEVMYTEGTLVVRQPEVGGLPSLQGITDYHNEWGLRLSDAVPMDLSVAVGAGSSDLQLAGLSLTGLNISLGAGESTVDLSGDWVCDLDVTIEAGLGEVSVRLPKDVGARVEVEAGVGTIEVSGLTQDGDIYTNAAYGVSAVTLHVHLEAGVGQINLQVAEAAAPPDYSAVTGELQQALAAAVERPETVFPGALMYVNSPELGAWNGAAGLADIGTGATMQPDDQFRAGSLMKPFISVVTLQLVEEGLFSLDDPMTAVLPASVTDKFAGSDQITVRMLLNHTSGIPEWSTEAADAEVASDPAKVWEVEEFLDLAAAQEPTFAPGEEHAYSNTNYNLLGLVIEEATARSWREEVRQRILQPLGLEDTSLPAPGETSIAGVHARGYEPVDGRLVDFTEVDPSMAGAAGGGALVTTASDLARFLDAVLAGELFQESGTLDAMLAFIDAPDEAGVPYWYGLGMEKYVLPGDVEMFGHLGCTAGYCSAVHYLPAQDITVAAMINIKDPGSLYFQLFLPTLELLVPGLSMPEQSAPEGAAYQDPQGRFSLPLVGEWTQLETDGSYALFEVPGIDFKLYALGVDSGDLAAGETAALNQVGIDPATLTKTDDAELGDWNINFYSLGGGQGVTPLCQVADQVTYCLIATGDESLTNNPPEHVMMTIQGFTIAGKAAALPSTVEDFEAYVNSLVGDNPPGLAIVINKGGDVLYAKGFGTADGPNEMAAAPDTVFPWGSMTKMATGTAIMQLVDQGLVDLDAPVSDYLDYFPAEHGITVRQLLDHSAGLREPVDFLLPSLRLDGQPLPDPDRIAKEYLEGFSGPMFEPGSASAYGNPHYVLLGQIVAEVSGQPYIDYVKEHILEPLGMENTDFTYSNQAMIAKAAAPAFPADLVEDFIAMMDRARGLGGGVDFIREVDDRFAWMNRFNVLAANGGLKGPATEVMRFAQMHLNGGELDGVRILSPESAALMQEMQFATTGDPLGYGAAWRIFDEAEHPFVEHDGGGTGLWAKMRLYPKEGLAIVLMSNASGWNRDKVADAAANVVFSMLGQ
jgi:D-alanyl-D-alanine carboxypeptidase